MISARNAATNNTNYKKIVLKRTNYSFRAKYCSLLICKTTGLTKFVKRALKANQ